MSYLIHINSYNIRTNRMKHNEDLPVFEIGHFEEGEWVPSFAKRLELKVDGNVVATMHYRKDSPLASGAHVWVEVEEDVELAGDDEYVEYEECEACCRRHHSVRYSVLFPDSEKTCDSCHQKALDDLRIGRINKPRNRVKCLKCQDIIESKDTHDFVWCKCGSVAVDGGDEYFKRCGMIENIEEMPYD